jgi:hypothetical protein
VNRALQFLIYNTPEENVSIRAVVKDETIWLTQKGMAQLFGCSSDNIVLHLKNIFFDGELDENSTTEEISVVQQEGNRKVQRTLKFYNLDAIISVGYRVHSRKATNFRIWATNVLKEYMVKGFAMDDERMKQRKNAFDKDYFKELLERVRSIRASERRIWLQITDIFAECSMDYDKNSEYNSANAYQSEAQLEQQLIERLQSQGYEYISVADETMLTDNVRRQLEALNAYAFTDPVLEQLECMEL